MARISEYTIHGPPAFDHSSSPLLHKSLTIRREQRASPTDLRTLFRHSADEDLPQEFEHLALNHNGVPATPTLPPTPPAVNGDASAHTYDESSSDAAAFRSTLATPINQNSPPTPDNTPPRDRKLPFASPFLGTQISLASTRAESFKTAREDFASEDESLLITPAIEQETPRARNYSPRVATAAHLHPQTKLAKSFLSEVKEPIAIGGPSMTGPTPSPPRETEGLDECKSHQELTSRTVEDKPDSNRQYSVIEGPLHGVVGKTLNGLQAVSFPDPDILSASPETNLRRGPSLRDRLHLAERFSPSASTEKFASIIGWTNAVDSNIGDDKRASGISTTSTISAIVVDTSPLPRRNTTLRKIAKNDSLRSASSPLPISHPNRASQSSSNDSPHRLVHKKIRLSNDNRHSFSSDPSRSHSISSSAVLPKVEVIRVAVIPERKSSLQSSAASSRRHSVSGTSHKTQISKDSNGLPPSSWQRKRTTSESQDRGREQEPSVAVPPRSSSLSAPTSRTTSRANSITSESVRIQRQRAEKDLRKTLDRMESDRLLSSLQKVQKQRPDADKESAAKQDKSEKTPTLSDTDNTPSSMPRQELPLVNIQLEPTIQHQQPTHASPGTSEWAALRPTSILDTPFSQPSYQSASPELNEATAVNFFPHNNHSLQLIEPNLTQQSKAVREVRKDEYLKDETQSPLRNPRRPPEPPRFNVIPPSPADELENQLGRRSGYGSMKRHPSQPRSESFVKSLARGLSLKNAKNRKASQDLDGSLHPFWRPRPFWDDGVDNNGNAVEEIQQRSLDESSTVGNSLGFPQSETVITGPVSLIRRISERRRQNKALVKRSSQSSLARLMASRELYKGSFLGMNFRLMSIHEMQERMLFARQRKEDERREKRRAALRESIGANVISQSDSRFPASSSSLIKV